MDFKKTVLRSIGKLLNVGYVMAGAPAIILNNKGEILLGKRSKMLPFYPGFWGLPGGLIGYKEEIEDAVKREIREEIGVEVKIIKIGKPCMHFPTKECEIQTLDNPIYCRITRGTPAPKDETEEVGWFRPKEIKKMKLAYAHKKILIQEGLLK